MSKCESAEMAVCAHLMGEMPPCCRVAFAVALLTGLVEELDQNGHMGEFKRDTGFHEGKNDVETSINVLKAVEELSNRAKARTGEFEA